MDVALDVLGSRLAEEWEVMMRALWTVLAWTAFLGTLTVALARLIWASLRGLRPRRFWCPVVGRDVEVRFEEWGPPGFRQVLRVAACSVFDPASALACRRVCLDVTRRPPSAPLGLSGMRAGAN
jgi:hypothetical protein